MSASRLVLIRAWSRPPGAGFVRVLRLRALPSPYGALALRIADR